MTQRAMALIHKGQFSRAVMLADSFGVALASAETNRVLTVMYPAPEKVLAQDLIELFGEPIPVVVDASSTTIPVEEVRECIAAATPLT